MTYHHDNREKRNQDKGFLRKLYEDYTPIHHDFFVDQYNFDKAKGLLKQYMLNRKIIKDAD